MTVYVIAKLVISDRDTYQTYADGFMAVFNRYSGKLLAVDENPEILEGEWPVTRTVLLEFPTKTALQSWYGSAEYQALAEHRFAASSADIVLLEGITAPSA